MPGNTPRSFSISGIDFPFFSCLIVSSNNKAPLINLLKSGDVNNENLNFKRFAELDSIPTLSSLFVMVPVLSSAAKIPLPLATINFAISFILII